MSDTMLEAIVGARVYDLTDMTSFLMAGNDNFGMAPSRLMVEAGPLQHGVTYAGYRLEPRTIILVIEAYGDDLAAYFKRRDTLLRIFKPSDIPIQLRYTTPLAVRQIDCFYNGRLSFPSDDGRANIQRTPVELFAPDPLWYDPVMQSVVFDVGGGGDSGTAVPTSIPMTVGASEIGSTKTVVYPGTFLSYPVVRIAGPIADPVVTNLTTGEKLDFTGTTIAEGDWYEVDCGYGAKTVLDAAGVNRIDRLSDDSDLATFHLERFPEAPEVGGSEEIEPPAANDIQVTGTGANAATEVYLQFYTRYVGV